MNYFPYSIINLFRPSYLFEDNSHFCNSMFIKISLRYWFKRNCVHVSSQSVRFIRNCVHPALATPSYRRKCVRIDFATPRFIRKSVNTEFATP